jgi:16S rRNA (guanine(966)-N(2))-methyltransferase RsmD
MGGDPAHRQAVGGCATMDGVTRIIAGVAGGRRIETPRGGGTRPTSDRVREALFSILGAAGPITGRVLDLYAGSGALGIEALSRGAESAVFVERDARAADVLRENLRALGAEAEVRRVDVLRALREARSGGETYDLVLCDPPYRLAPELGGPLGEALVPVLAGGARVVTESDRRVPLDLDIPLTDERRYGDTLIRIHSS